ncbi:MAG: extracellular solute-binding protein [Clostridia bacterium]|nr:extracellular solute-binding protein [Clostridia bacterium]
MLKTSIRRLISVLLIITINTVVSNCFLAVSAEITKDNKETDEVVSNNTDSYFYYYEKYKDEMYSATETVLEVGAAVPSNPIENIDDLPAVRLESEDDSIIWSVTVPRTGNYIAYIDYYSLDGINDTEISLLIDGEVPFSEAKAMSLPRIWKDSDDIENGSFKTDFSGNDLTPSQEEVKRWNRVAFSDMLGMYSQPYIFNLEKGEHTVTLKNANIPVAVSKVVFGNMKEVPAYKEYISQYSNSDHVSGESVRQEAELAFEKTDSSLSPKYDRSNGGTLPNDPVKIRLNTIGGSSWTTCGDSISWQVDVEKEGLYRLAFRVRQNFSEGMNSYRRLYVNGEIPFKEAEKVKFEFDPEWYIKVVGDDEPLYIHLKKGDIITLECTSGPMDYPLREVQKAVLDLNEIYREIIMITGVTPSMYQDYELDSQLPELTDDLTAVSKRLNLAADAITKEMGKSSTGVATILKAVKIIDELAEDPFYIPDRLSNFKTNIESLSSLLLTLGGQAVELDSIHYIPKGAEIPEASIGLFANLSYKFKRFIATFSNDYNIVSSAGADSDKSILVWADLGRDQAQILNRLIEENFTTKTEIPIVLNLVSGASTLIKAVLAGKGPDVVLHIDAVTPVNLAARGALVDLSQFDLSVLQAETYDSAWTTYKYQGGIYGIPVTQNCDMLFYRTDIFESLGLNPPETWNEFYNVLEVLQSKNLQVGLPEINSADAGNSLAISVFSTLLFQNGGDYFTDDLSKTLFDTEVANIAFEKTVELYRVYGITREISIFNRFRSGEAPLSISSYSFYTQLTASAPEIAGLWDFTLIPGTVKEDGSVERTESATASGSIMLTRAVERGVENEAFEFMKWWASAETQTTYGRALEGILGVIGRITPANYVALENLGWSKSEFNKINTQLSVSYNQAAVVGNYQITRSLTSAIRSAINDKNSPRRALALYNKDINDEISRKRKEFNIGKEGN